jgi:xanthine dehydrogenase accessory factor
MRDVLPEIEAWRAERRQFALATVVQTWGSAPRTAGSRMLVAADGRIAGSVSGGCVEAAVIEAAQDTLKTGAPRLLSFGVADETAWAVGLACGGTIEVFVEVPPADILDAARGALCAERSAVLATVVKGSPSLLGTRLLLAADGPAAGTGSEEIRAAAQAVLDGGRPGRSSVGDIELFVDHLRPSPTLVLVGGVHIAIALVRLARALGYRPIVVDPRPTFADPARFPEADRVVASWPDEALGAIGLNPGTAVAVLTHDPKLDDPALRAALPSPAFYVGALGSKTTQEKRRRRLLEAGLTESQIARLHAPIGLDLGGRSPEEIALSVMAEIVAVRNGGRGRSEAGARAAGKAAPEQAGP